MSETKRPLEPAGTASNEADATPIPRPAPLPTDLCTPETPVRDIQSLEAAFVLLASRTVHNDTAGPLISMRMAHGKPKGVPVKARARHGSKPPCGSPKVHELPTAKGSPMRVIMEKMVAEGIIPQGAQWMGVKVPKPLTITETFEQLKALKQIDFYTVMRVILQWKPERLLSANHVKGVVRLMNEGRLASIPNILRTIEINPADGGQVIGSNAGQTLDGIVSETARLLEEVDTDKE